MHISNHESKLWTDILTVVCVVPRRIVLDRPTLRFKVAAALYTLAQEGSIKVKADVASIGESTLRRWLASFAAAIRVVLKPIYMPGTPFTPADRAAVQGQFASRRGIKVASLAT